MPINPSLLTSGGTQSQITVLSYGVVIPPTITITVGTAASKGDTVLQIRSDADFTAYAGLTFKVGTAPNEQWVVVAPDSTNTTFSYSVTATPVSTPENPVTSTPTNINVEPLTADIPVSATGTTYGAFPLIGLEAANMQLQSEANSVVLLANGGWRVKDYSTGSFDFSGTLYLPTTAALAKGAYAVADALLAKSNVYFERVLPDGTYHAGLCMVESASDTTQGAQYISQSVTFGGSGVPVQERLNAA